MDADRVGVKVRHGRAPVAKDGVETIRDAANKTFRVTGDLIVLILDDAHALVVGVLFRLIDARISHVSVRLNGLFSERCGRHIETIWTLLARRAHGAIRAVRFTRPKFERKPFRFQRAYVRKGADAYRAAVMSQLMTSRSWDPLCMKSPPLNFLSWFHRAM